MNEVAFESSYIPLNIAASIKEWKEGVQSGDTCRIDHLKDTFAWMRGHVNGWYGWANDGKSLFLDIMNVTKAKHDGFKFALYKGEDMDAISDGKNVKIQANRIYKNLAWSLTGKTWNKNFADRWHAPRMTLSEENDALDFITEHFYVIYPKDRTHTNIIAEFYFLWKKFGINVFQIDPWNLIRVVGDGRDDERLVNAFIDIKEFALTTNSIVNIVAHPKSMSDIKEKNGAFKVVNQFMILGGAAWDMKMDGQFSVYRPERHINPSDTKVALFNLKQKEAEIVGVQRGECSGIEFDKRLRTYYFAGVDPINGRVKEDPLGKKTPSSGSIFDKPVISDPEGLPF